MTGLESRLDRIEPDEWFFAGRLEGHRYSADLLERPQEAGFAREQSFRPPALTTEWANRSGFRVGRSINRVTSGPVS